MCLNNNFVSLGVALKAIWEGKLGEYDLDGNYRDDADTFDIYSEVRKVTIADMVYVGEPNEIPDDLDDDDIDEALIPQPAKDKGWELLYSGQLVEDVICNLKHQGVEMDLDIVLKAINYYMQQDCFYDFQDPIENAGSL